MPSVLQGNMTVRADQPGPQSPNNNPVSKNSFRVSIAAWIMIHIASLLTLQSSLLSNNNQQHTAYLRANMLQ